MHDPSSLQLQNDLRTSIIRALATRRPILTHLNADTSWLLSLAQPIPLPSDASARSLQRQRRFNILIDPWLKGPQSDVAGWFSTQWHAIDSCVQTIAELERCLEEVEQLAAEAEEVETKEKEKSKKRSRRSISKSTPNGHLPPHNATNGTNTASNNPTRDPNSSYVSAVLISHEFTDHCHRATLLELPPLTPIYAAASAVSLIKSWSHFHHVYSIPSFDPTAPWPEKEPSETLPEWLRIARVTTESNALYYHAALAVMFKRLEQGAEEEAEAIIYTPHGISATSLAPLLSPQPSPLVSSKTRNTNVSVHPLALLHGLHRIKLHPASQLNLGLPNAEEIVRPKDRGARGGKKKRLRYWVGTHDEVKKASGVVSWLLSREVWGVGDTLKRILREEGEAEGKEEEAEEEGVRYVELASGEGLLLE